MEAKQTMVAKRKAKAENRQQLYKGIKKNWELYLLIILPVIYFIVFKYIPLYGAQIAFRDYNIAKGMADSPWVGLKYFQKFIDSYTFESVIKNTLEISLLNIVLGFPIPILLALGVNYCTSNRFSKAVQMVTYAPHFISTVVIAGIVVQILAPQTGVVNNIIEVLGGERVSFLDNENYFSTIFVVSEIWQHAGFASIIYIAALAGIDPELHQAAVVDGASKLKRIWHIDIASIMPTIVVLLILRVGRVMDIGFEKVLLLQNPANAFRSEIVSTYVYKIGLASSLPNYSYASAIGLFLAIINFILLIVVNQISKKLNETSIF